MNLKNSSKMSCKLPDDRVSKGKLLVLKTFRYLLALQKKVQQLRQHYHSKRITSLGRLLKKMRKEMMERMSRLVPIPKKISKKTWMTKRTKRKKKLPLSRKKLLQNNSHLRNLFSKIYLPHHKRKLREDRASKEKRLASSNSKCHLVSARSLELWPV